MADIEVCFCFPRIHSDLAGAFGFIAGGYHNLATAMVFGSTTSASSWEPFQRAIEALSVAYADRPDLVITHKYYLNMISWAKHDPTAKITPAFPCLMNKGTLEAHGNRANSLLGYTSMILSCWLFQEVIWSKCLPHSLRLFLPLWASQIRQFVNALLQWISGWSKSLPQNRGCLGL
jgi:hypothetical protein